MNSLWKRLYHFISAYTHAHTRTCVNVKVTSPQTTSPQTEVEILKKSKSKKIVSQFHYWKSAFLPKHVSPSAFLPQTSKNRFLTRKNHFFASETPKFRLFYPSKTPRTGKTPKTMKITPFFAKSYSKSDFPIRLGFLTPDTSKNR